MGIGCVTVFADDDAGSSRGVFGRESATLRTLGPAAYLDGARLNTVARYRMRRHPPRLRFSERTGRIRRSLRVGGSGSDWPDARATRSFRRQGQGEGARRAVRRPLAARGAHAVSLKEARGLLRRSQRRGRDDQGDRRRGCGIRAVRRESDVEEAYRHSRQC
jgi:hypothetical protein